METKTNIQATERLLLPARAVAELLGISTRQVWSLKATGQLPQPLRLRRSVRWRCDKLITWLDAGCDMRQFGAEGGAGAGATQTILLDPTPMMGYI